VGLAFASGDDPHATTEALVRDADTAMYQAKEAGRDKVAVFDESMRDEVSERVELERDLRSAVSLNQLHLVYQPIVALPRGPSVAWKRLSAGPTPLAVCCPRPCSSRLPKKAG